MRCLGNACFGTMQNARGHHPRINPGFNRQSGSNHLSCCYFYCGGDCLSFKDTNRVTMCEMMDTTECLRGEMIPCTLSYNICNHTYASMLGHSRIAYRPLKYPSCSEALMEDMNQIQNRQSLHTSCISPHLEEGWLCLSSSYSGGRSYTGRISSSDSSSTIGIWPGIDSAVDLLLAPGRVGIIASSGRAGGNRSSAVHKMFELVRTRRLV